MYRIPIRLHRVCTVPCQFIYPKRFGEFWGTFPEQVPRCFPYSEIVAEFESLFVVLDESRLRCRNSRYQKLRERFVIEKSRFL